MTDPLLYLGSVGSVISFEGKLAIEQVSGQEGFGLDGTVLTGKPGDHPGAVSDSSGIVRIRGSVQQISFTAVSPGNDDGIYLQIVVPSSVLTIVDRATLTALVGRIDELTAPHQLGELYDDPGSGDALKQLLAGWAHQPTGTLVPALKGLAERLTFAGGVVEAPRNRIHIPDLQLPARLDPKITVTNRVLGRLVKRPSWLRPNWFDDQRIEPVMAAPHFDHPMYEALDRYDRNWLIPGLGTIPDPDLVTVLQTNSRFVEAFLVGLNHEFARELLWREYPTDGRGTSFRSFWTSGSELLADVNAFDPNLALGAHLDPNLSGRLVLLVRGEVVRRYPGLLAHAVRHANLTDGRPVFGRDAAVARTLFQVNLAPDLLLVGFDLTADQVDADDTQPGGPIPASGAYWFLLAENPTEPRFGLDDGDPGLLHLRDDLTWPDLLPPGERFLRPFPPRLVTDGPSPPAPAPLPVTWGATASAVAHILYNPPARAAFRAAPLLKDAQ